MGMSMTEKILARVAGRDVVWSPMLINVLRADSIIPLLEVEHLLLPQTS
jgi:hypothetical protein